MRPSNHVSLVTCHRRSLELPCLRLLLLCGPFDVTELSLFMRFMRFRSHSDVFWQQRGFCINLAGALQTHQCPRKGMYLCAIFLIECRNSFHVARNNCSLPVNLRGRFYVRRGMALMQFTCQPPRTVLRSQG